MAVEPIPEDPDAAGGGPVGGSSNNPLSRKLNRLLESRLENDRETLEALRSLSEFFTENNIRTRRRLRGDLEKRSLAINEEFVQSFSDLKASMSALSEDITAMSATCAGMVRRLQLVKRDTHDLLARTGQLRAEARRLDGRQQAAQGFLAAFQPSAEQAAVLRGAGGPMGRDQLDDRFLDALAQSRRMHDHCKLLLRSSRAQAGLQLMESLAAQVESKNAPCVSRFGCTLKIPVWSKLKSPDPIQHHNQSQQPQAINPQVLQPYNHSKFVAT